MTKEKNGNEYTRSFYFPHDPLATAYKGELTNYWTGEVTTPPSMTKQEFVAECDIKNILADYNSTGQIRHLNPQAAAAQYAELPVATDFQEALNIVLDAEKAFANLPSSIRSRFGNSPEKFLEFIHDADNQEEAIKMGLATDNRPPEPEIPPSGDKKGGPPSEGA